jgi:DNA-binding transcriptional MerR regulator
MAARKKTMPRFSIGEIARQAACQVQTIRYYEQIKILPRPARTEGGHRLYAPDHLERLQFVRRSRELGFALDAVRELLRLADRREDDCATVDRIASEHLAEVRQKISQLRTLERELKRMVTGCNHGKIADCRIIGALSD